MRFSSEFFVKPQGSGNELPLHSKQGRLEIQSI